MTFKTKKLVYNVRSIAGKLQYDDKVKDTDAGFATVEESAVGKAKTDTG